MIVRRATWPRQKYAIRKTRFGTYAVLELDEVRVKTPRERVRYESRNLTRVEAIFARLADGFIR